MNSIIYIYSFIYRGDILRDLLKINLAVIFKFSFVNNNFFFHFMHNRNNILQSSEVKINRTISHIESRKNVS